VGITISPRSRSGEKHTKIPYPNIFYLSTCSHPGIKGSQHIWLKTSLPSVSRLSIKCGIPDISWPYGPPWPVTGMALPLLTMSRFIDNSNYSFSSCLQSWLEQDTSCPTCRMILSTQSPAGLGAANRLDHNLLAGENQVDNQTTNRRPPNHFFHFDGNYCSGTFTTTDNYIFIFLCLFVFTNSNL
jgi:hypothetical protein